MGNKGSSTTTTSANPAAMAQYQSLLSRAGNVAQQPYSPYGGELVAPVNAQQNLGIENINQYAGFASPYIQSAADYANRAAQPLTAGQISGYQSPYTQQVVDATQAQFNNSNAQQQNSLRGNAAAQGALGGDSVGIAQAQLAGQQNMAQAPVIAGLYNQGYNTALQTAMAQQQNLGNAAYSLGNLGISGQNAALTGAGAQLGAGGLEQQYQQGLDTANYGQFQIGQAFPYQQTQWLAGLQSGLGPLMGSSTTGPKPSMLSQLGGLGLAGAGLIGGTGGFGQNGWLSGLFAKDGGRIAGFDSGGGVGGMPYSGVAGYIPAVQMGGGRGLSAPAAHAEADPLKQALEYANIGKTFAGFGRSNDGGGFYGGSPESNPRLNPATYGNVANDYKRGGFAHFPRGYADAGAVKGDFGVAASDYRPDMDMWGRFPVPSAMYENYGENRDALVNYGRNSPYAPEAPVPLPRSRPAMAGVMPEMDPGPADDGGNLPPRARPTAGFGEPPVVDDGGAGVAAPAGNAGWSGYSPLWSGVMAAGLGMMASKSPFPGVAIGEGGLAGLQTYTSEQKRMADEAARKVTQGQQGKRIDLEAKRLQQAADQAAAHLKLQTEQFAESKRQHAAAEDKPIAMSPTQALVKPRTGEVVRNAPMPLSETALEIGARQMVAGDMSPLVNVGRGAQGDEKINAYRNRASEILVTDFGLTPAQAAQHISKSIQDYKARGIGTSAAARTGGTREANLDIILRATEAAVPAALETSERLGRTGFVPVNKVIQMVQSGTSTPELREFGMANLQLAEHWARAMNPTGVMRESDRTKALEFLSTADSPETYRRVVTQLQKQIQRERDAVSGTHTAPSGPAQGGATPSAGPTAPRVKQNGHTYERQPDGSYKAID